MAAENSTQTLYRFFDPVGARLTLETGMLRVGRLSEFNDPFDFGFGIDPESKLPKTEREPILKDYLERFEKKFGVICLSREWPQHQEVTSKNSQFIGFKWFMAQ